MNTVALVSVQDVPAPHGNRPMLSHDGALGALFPLEFCCQALELIHQLRGRGPDMRFVVPATLHQGRIPRPPHLCDHVHVRSQHRRRRLFCHYLCGNAVEGPLAEGHVPHDESSGVDVHLFVIVRIVEEHLWRHVPHRACLARHPVGARDFLQLFDFREPKVADLKVPVLVEQQVCRLEVAVDDDGVAVVEEAERPGQFNAPLQDQLGRRLPGLGGTPALAFGDEVVLQIAAREVLADDDERLLDRAGAQENDEVWMPQARQQADFVDEVCFRHRAIYCRRAV